MSMKNQVSAMMYYSVIQVSTMSCFVSISLADFISVLTEQDNEDKSEWRRSWQDQVAELKRRGMTKDSEENLSWGARMRRRRAESSSAE